MSYFRAVVKKNAVLDTKKSKDSPKENQGKSKALIFHVHCFATAHPKQKIAEFIFLSQNFSCFRSTSRLFNIVFVVLVDKSSEKVNDTALGAVDFGLLQNEENVTNRRSTKYTQYSNKNRYDIGKYAAENGNANAVRFFQK